MIKLLSYSANGVFFSGKDFKNKFKKNTWKKMESEKMHKADNIPQFSQTQFHHQM